MLNLVQVFEAESTATLKRLDKAVEDMLEVEKMIALDAIRSHVAEPRLLSKLGGRVEVLSELQTHIRRVLESKARK